MRILLGSIGMIDDNDQPGITSPDYVVLRTKDKILHPLWFYYWLRSSYGETFIKSLARGAVRERMLFRRLADASIKIPSWDIQLLTAQKLAQIRLLRNTIAEELSFIEKLPPVCLLKAFKGEI